MKYTIMLAIVIAAVAVIIAWLIYGRMKGRSLVEDEELSTKAKHALDSERTIHAICYTPNENDLYKLTLTDDGVSFSYAVQGKYKKIEDENTVSPILWERMIDLLNVKNENENIGKHAAKADNSITVEWSDGYAESVSGDNSNIIELFEKMYKNRQVKSY